MEFGSRTCLNGPVFSRTVLVHLILVHLIGRSIVPIPVMSPTALLSPVGSL